MLPPDNPNIPLNNYLLKLRRDIKIVGISSLLQNWHNNLFKDYNIPSKKIGISESFYRRLISGEVAIPIWVLKLLLKIDPDLSNKIYQKSIYFTVRTKKDLLPKSINPKLAYYIGYLHGDGHIDSNEKRISFFDKYIEQLEVINKLTKILFNTQGQLRIRKDKKLNREVPTFDVRRVTINSFLSNVVGIKRGRRDSNKIPVIIKKNKILLRWYLCGLFDAEGAMPLNPKNRRNIYIDIAMKDITLIKSVEIVLKKVFGIKAYGPYTRIAKNKKIKRVTIESELRIRKLSEIKKFLTLIGTIHPDKIRRKELILHLLDLNQNAPVAQSG